VVRDKLKPGQYVSFPVMLDFPHSAKSTWFYGEIVDHTVHRGEWLYLIACHNENGTVLHRVSWRGIVLKDMREFNKEG